ncbi:MAG: exported protein of unknown function, partial [Candidatus Saccharibacteria bacterium]|nr:exported protein of unknown function [Candidatus Saccharibacteria bacterium]
YMIGTDTGNNTCHLSSLSYPFLLSASLFSSGHSVACSGAKIRDIIDASEAYEGQVKDGIAKKERSNPGMIYTNYLPGYFIQNEFVQKYNPRAVTLSIGGNDIGFSDIVKQCVMPKLRNTTCYPTYEDQKELANRISSIGSKLTNAYRTISNVGRRVYVIGYPQIVASNGNCAANVHLDAKEIELFTGLTDVLNATIKDAAEKANAQYVDVSEAFVGHRMCETKSSDVAVNGFTTGNDDGLKRMKFIGSESYHPNALGHELLARAVLGQTNNLKQATTFPNPALSPVIFPLPQAPKTARATSFSIYSSTLLPDIITSSSPIAIQVDADTALLKSSSEFTVKLDDSGIVLGTANTDTKGNLTGGVTLPAVTTCGYHTVHVAGVNLLGQAIDISKVVYVNSEAGTCSETNDSLCGSVPSSGQDADQDKLDDACDPLITDPPTTPTYTVHLTGSYIHAVKTTRGIAATITPPNAAPLPTEEVMAPVSVRSRQTAYWKVGENIVTSFALFLVLVCGGQLRGRRKL